MVFSNEESKLYAENNHGNCNPREICLTKLWVSLKNEVEGGINFREVEINFNSLATARIAHIFNFKENSSCEHTTSKKSCRLSISVLLNQAMSKYKIFLHGTSSGHKNFRELTVREIDMVQQFVLFKSIQLV